MVRVSALRVQANIRNEIEIINLRNIKQLFCLWRSIKEGLGFNELLNPYAGINRIRFNGSVHDTSQPNGSPRELSLK